MLDCSRPLSRPCYSPDRAGTLIMNPDTMQQYQHLQQERDGLMRAIDFNQQKLERARHQYQKELHGREAAKEAGKTRKERKALRHNGVRALASIKTCEDILHDLCQRLGNCNNQLQIMEQGIYHGYTYPLGAMWHSTVGTIDPLPEHPPLGHRQNLAHGEHRPAEYLGYYFANRPHERLPVGGLPAETLHSVSGSNANKTSKPLSPVAAPFPHSFGAKQPSSDQSKADMMVMENRMETMALRGPESEPSTPERGRKQHKRRPSEEAIQRIEWRLKHSDPTAKKRAHRRSRTLDSYSPIEPVVWGYPTEEEQRLSDRPDVIPEIVEPVPTRDGRHASPVPSVYYSANTTPVSR